MMTHDALHRLGALQNRVLSCIAGSCALVRQGPERHEELARRRWAMMRLMREYQLFKHVELFDPAIMSGTLAQAEAARAMKRRCVAGAEDFKRHVTCWSSQAIALNWESYALAMLAISARLVAHVERERQEVEALLKGARTTRHLPRDRPVSG